MITPKVIIIEDDPVLRASIEQTLELEGFDTISTGSFTQARRSIRSNFRGVILSDIKMPDHDGFEVLKFAHSKDPDLPVVLLTAHSDVPTAMRAVRDGAYDYLEKPCDPDRLIEALRRAQDHRKLVIENRAMKEDLGHAPEDSATTLNERLELYEKRIIEQALVDEGGKVAAAADRLGLPRNTLYDRISKLKIILGAFKGSR